MNHLFRFPPIRGRREQFQKAKEVLGRILAWTKSRDMARDRKDPEGRSSEGEPRPASSRPRPGRGREGMAPDVSFSGDAVGSPQVNQPQERKKTGGVEALQQAASEIFPNILLKWEAPPPEIRLRDGGQVIPEGD